MKALRKIHPGQGGVRLEDVPIPLITDDELLVRVEYSGICGTDMHIVRDEYKANMPVTMGHEFSGVVEKTGKDVKGFSAGDRIVSMTPGYVCGTCPYCRSGLLLQCPERKSIGSGMDGAMAEYLAVKADRSYLLDPGISLREAALTEPIGCCVRSVVEISKVRAGDYVYVSGPGTIGQIVAQLAALLGAHVTVGGIPADKDRLAFAKKNGADGIVIAGEEDVFERARSITHGGMFDVVFECAGAEQSAELCLRLLRKCGQYVQVGLFGKKILFDMDSALIDQKHIVNSFGAERTSFERALRLMASGKLKIAELVSREAPITEWESAFESAFKKEGFKVLLMPNQA